MRNPLTAKLEHGADLTNSDRAVLDGLVQHVRHVPAHQNIIREGERPELVRLVLDGFACRYKLLRGGERQIMALLVPGDLCDLHVTILDRMDHGLATLSPCTLVDIPPDAILELTDQHPQIARALRWSTLVDEGTLRAWLVNLGQRDADLRMAHFFCELLMRLQSVGFADENTYDLPINQIELGEALGISVVHTNRTLQQLREANLIEFRNRRLVIHDVPKLKAYCGFDPAYLHLQKRQRN